MIAAPGYPDTDVHEYAKSPELEDDDLDPSSTI
jgi:hypothetical protein